MREKSETPWQDDDLSLAPVPGGGEERETADDEEDLDDEDEFDEDEDFDENEDEVEEE